MCALASFKTDWFRQQLFEICAGSSDRDRVLVHHHLNQVRQTHQP